MTNTAATNHKISNGAAVPIDIRHIMKQLGIPEDRCPQELLAKSAMQAKTAETKQPL